VALYHRDRVSKHLSNLLDQRTLADLPRCERIAQLVRVRWAHSQVGLYLGDLGAFKQILKLYTPEAFVRF
jgi:hypothetical protein